MPGPDPESFASITEFLEAFNACASRMFLCQRRSTALRLLFVRTLRATMFAKIKLPNVGQTSVYSWDLNAARHQARDKLKLSDIVHRREDQWL